MTAMTVATEAQSVLFMTKLDYIECMIDKNLEEDIIDQIQHRQIWKQAFFICWEGG